jgi:hypothetical protein
LKPPLKIFEAAGAASLLMNAKNGEGLTIISFPGI